METTVPDTFIKMIMDATPVQRAALFNTRLGGFNKLIDLRFTSVSLEEVTAEVEVGSKHTQPYGIVHGGVYASVVETLCSTGAVMHVLKEGHSVVGLDNHTSFLRATRNGKLIVMAKPITTGRRTHVWRADVFDEENRLVASGQVRLIILERGAPIAGEAPPTMSDESLGQAT